MSKRLTSAECTARSVAAAQLAAELGELAKALARRGNRQGATAARWGAWANRAAAKTWAARAAKGAGNA